MPSLAEQPFRSIGLIGLGLMGGSFALAVQARWPGLTLAAYDPSLKARQWALANGSIRPAASIEELAALSELLVIAAPLEQFEGIMGTLSQALRADSVIIDLASTKASALAYAAHFLGPLLPRFVACHPIAGSELSGAQHARADLFRDKPVVLTPLATTADDALGAVQNLWQALGARLVLMQAERHDALFAYLSHAPHLLAFVYMLQAEALSEDELALAGSGFRDFTRIAGSNPELWAGILLDNRAAVIELLQQQRLGIARMEELLDKQQREPLVKALSVARERRAGLA
jgi:prephenate dehydrogenase